MTIIYADNNATTRIAPEVHEAMVPFFTEQYFNPSSMYDPAKEVADHVARAREQIAGQLGAADAKEILFTSCATESNNTAIRGTANASPSRRQIITTAVEHPAVLEVCKDLQRSGYKVTFLPVDQSGNLDVAEFVRALSTETLLVTVMHANNETGVIFPIEQLARLTKETDPRSFSTRMRRSRWASCRLTCPAITGTWTCFRFPVISCMRLKALGRCTCGGVRRASRS